MTQKHVLHRGTYYAALFGRLPAEALVGTDRDRLLRVLVWRGWTDLRIAEHTKWSTYTVARIRDRMGLSPNIEKGAAA